MSATGFAEPSLVTMRKALLCNTVRTTKKKQILPILKKYRCSPVFARVTAYFGYPNDTLALLMGYCCSANLHFKVEFGIFKLGDDIMKQFTPSEAKKLVKDILAQKKQKAEYFQAKGTLKGFAPTK